jgi:hypothetical protein
MEADHQACGGGAEGVTVMQRLWVGNRKELPAFASQCAARQGGSIPQPVMGILNGDAIRCIKEGGEWIYFDHAYFNRGWHRSNFRVCRNGLHMTEQLIRPPDRFDRTGYEVEPWRKTGREIVIIPPTDAQMAVYGNHEWLLRTETRLCEITDRPVTCKRDKSTSLRQFLDDAWAVVTYASVAGVEATLMGVPVFSTEHCPSWPVNSGRLEDIETPTYADNRREWASSLAYASWNWDEMKSIKWDDYRYELCAS